MTDLDLGNDAFPTMAVGAGTLSGMPVMVARLSFSGELAFEVYAPAHLGRPVWEALIAAGEPQGIMPYGTEALGTLRIEKGHVSAPELDGRTTMADLGLGWDDACLSPQENKRWVGTASSMQVRREVYQGSSERWKHYRPFLNGALDHFAAVPE